MDPSHPVEESRNQVVESKQEGSLELYRPGSQVSGSSSDTLHRSLQEPGILVHNLATRALSPAAVDMSILELIL